MTGKHLFTCKAEPPERVSSPEPCAVEDGAPAPEGARAQTSARGLEAVVALGSGII